MGHMGCRLKEEEARLEMQRRSLGMLQQAWWVCTLELMERSVKIRKQIFTAVFFTWRPFSKVPQLLPRMATWS
jgi:hypothetical protein